MGFLITTIVAVILLVGVVSACSSVCSCTGNVNRLYVSCSSRGLDNIPTDLPNNTSILRLERNDISEIENNAFNNLPSLRYIFLHINQITSIQAGAFHNLTSLTYLNLRDNKITSIQAGTFNHLTNLTYLRLSSNQITSIQEGEFNNLRSLSSFYLYSNQITSIQEGAFHNLTSLTYLYLYDNQITSIQSGTFNNLQSLTQLGLHSNQITSIQEGAFNSLTSLTELLLRNNPISFVSENAFQNLPQLTSLEFDMHCGDCDTIPFWRWLTGNQTFSKSVTCNDYDGKTLSSLQPNDFIGCFMDPCYSNPCLNNGICTNDGKGSALCSCHGDWTGSQCELSPCSTVVCNDKECYYNESGIAKCFNQAVKYCQVTSQSDEQSTTYHTLNIIYAVIGTIIVTTLVCVTVFLVILRYRRGKADGDTNRQNGQNTSEYQNDAFTNDYVNIGKHNAQSHYEATIPSAQEQTYEAI